MYIDAQVKRGTYFKNFRKLLWVDDWSRAHGNLVIEMRFADELRKDSAQIWESIFSHPFIQELGRGTLAKERFFYFLKQDWLYSQDFARALCIVGSKAPTAEYLQMFAKHAAFVVEAEHSMQLKLTGDYGILRAELEGTTKAPVTQAYVGHLLARVHQGSFGEGVATVLPCTWIYFLVGKRLAESTPKDPFYAEWVKTYNTKDIEANVNEELDVISSVAEKADRDEKERMKDSYHVSTRYEYLFWDQAYRMNSWPL